MAQGRSPAPRRGCRTRRTDTRGSTGRGPPPEPPAGRCWDPIRPDEEVAADLVGPPVHLREQHSRVSGLDVHDRHVSYSEADVPALAGVRVGQVLEDLGLRVEPAGRVCERPEVDPVPGSSERQVDALVLGPRRTRSTRRSRRGAARCPAPGCPPGGSPRSRDGTGSRRRRTRSRRLPAGGSASGRRDRRRRCRPRSWSGCGSQATESRPVPRRRPSEPSAEWNQPRSTRLATRARPTPRAATSSAATCFARPFRRLGTTMPSAATTLARHGSARPPSTPQAHLLDGGGVAVGGRGRAASATCRLGDRVRRDAAQVGEHGRLHRRGCVGEQDLSTVACIGVASRCCWPPALRRCRPAGRGRAPRSGRARRGGR